MKTYLPILSFLLAWTVAVSAEEAKQDAAPNCCQKPLEQGSPLSDRSIYQVESAWTNDVGKTFKLAQLRGQPQVITMFFASCEFACPVLVHDMQQIEARLPESVRSQIGFTLVSFDTDRDTPLVLEKYRRQHSLASNRWALLRGKADDVLELAALLGVRFKKDARGQFAHSNIITVLNADGEIVRQQTGLAQSHEETVKTIEKLLADSLKTGGEKHASPGTSGSH
jgi:protein SCO1